MLKLYTQLSHQRISGVQPAQPIDIPVVLQSNEVAHLFWVDSMVPLAGSAYIPDHLLQGLWTCVERAKLKPVVYAYQQLLNLPVGVESASAERFLSACQFEQLLHAGATWLHYWNDELFSVSLWVLLSLLASLVNSLRCSFNLETNVAHVRNPKVPLPIIADFVRLAAIKSSFEDLAIIIFDLLPRWWDSNLAIRYKNDNK